MRPSAARVGENYLLGGADTSYWSLVQAVGGTSAAACTAAAPAALADAHLRGLEGGDCARLLTYARDYLRHAVDLLVAELLLLQPSGHR